MIWLMVAVVCLLFVINLLFLRGEDLSAHDAPRPVSKNADRAASEQHHAAVASLAEMSSALNDAPRKDQLKVMRESMDEMGVDVAFDGQIIPVDNGVVRGEWLVAPGADTRKRVLYIHGGAWIAGSPLSHRAITSRYASMLGGAVFSLDYRLMPEHSRQDGIDDCRAAYRWILENGPEGPGEPVDLVVSGDSAGGNLTLALINWVRDQGLRPPSAAVALSPATDGTFSSPSMKSNLATDHMLGPLFGKLNMVPKWILHWMALFNHRIRPSHPVVSPVFDDLSGLPPTLVHVSAQEMLLDDAVRYVNKAIAQGSPAVLQAWDDMLHVWHIFVADMPEAEEAFAEIEKFIAAHSSSAPTEAAA